MNWTFSKIWNESLEAGRPERPVEPRDHMWASELGGSDIDIFLKMKGEKPTNPPNKRSFRKFEAGNIWEWILGIVLKRAGILRSTQNHLKYQYPGMLEVTGKLDMIAGGTPNWDNSFNAIEDLELPQSISKATSEIIESFRTKYPGGVNERVMEIKSVGSFMFNRIEALEQPMGHHELQLFHYLKAGNYNNGSIVYVCRDDCRIAEFFINLNNESIEDRYKEKIKQVSDYVLTDTTPPLEKMLKFEDGKFGINWKVGYSNYLEKLYGYKQQMEYDDEYRPMTQRFNRVLKRVIEGKDMTPKNEEVLEEIKKQGFKVADVIKETKLNTKLYKENVEA